MFDGFLGLMGNVSSTHGGDLQKCFLQLLSVFKSIFEHFANIKAGGVLSSISLSIDGIPLQEIPYMQIYCCIEFINLTPDPGLFIQIS